MIRALCLAAALMVAASMWVEAQEKSVIKFCDNSGAPNKKNEVHKCACQQTTRTDCDAKPEYNMPGCSTNCRPEACKCTPEKCS